MTSLIDTATVNLVARVSEWATDSSGFFSSIPIAHPKYRSAAILELHRCDVATKAILED